MSQRPSGDVIMPTAWRLIIMAIAGVAGCASQPAQAPRRDLLDVVADGRTHCAEVEGHLGAPEGWYEGGRLMTYRISGDAQHGYRVIKDDSWSDANLSLVITCGSDGIVTRHALVAVKEAAP